MPDSWSWDQCYLLCRERIDRMKMACNRYWAIVYTEESLLCEILVAQSLNSLLRAPFLGL